MNLLFVNEYLRHGGTFPATTEISNVDHPQDDHGNVSSGTTWSGLLHNWCSTAKDACADSINLDEHMTSLAGSMSVVFIPKGDVRNNTPHELAKNVFTQESECCQTILQRVAATKQQQAAALEQDAQTLYSTLAQQLLQAWEIAAAPLVTAVKAAVTEKETLYEPGDASYMTLPDMMPPPGMNTTTKGKLVYQFISDFKSMSFSKSDCLSDIEKKMTTRELVTIFGCFAPGTKIQTAEGEKPIETIIGGTSVKSLPRKVQSEIASRFPSGAGNYTVSTAKTLSSLTATASIPRREFEQLIQWQLGDRIRGEILGDWLLVMSSFIVQTDRPFPLLRLSPCPHR